jgi:CBS domain-containing protein
MTHDREGVIAMKAADVMVSNVITVSPDASVQDVADILLTNRISAVPVVGRSGELIGIISEGDLIRRAETGTERRRSWWLELLVGRTPLAADYVKSHARTVADVMTRTVITAIPDTPLRDIAALLEKNHIKRVPIVKNRKVVGIVSRANLVQALASRRKEIEAQPAIDDTAIREEVMARLDAESWSRFTPVNVIVHDGTVDLWGIVDSETAKKAVRVAAEATPGVRAVNDNLSYSPSSLGRNASIAMPGAAGVNPRIAAHHAASRRSRPALTSQTQAARA